MNGADIPLPADNDPQHGPPPPMPAPPGPNQTALQALVDRNELADESDRVGLCDGTDPNLVKRYFDELVYVPDGMKLRVMRRTGRGAFRKELEDYIADHVVTHGYNPIDDPEYEVISHDATRLTLRKKRRQPQGGDRSRFKRFRAGNRKRSRERERFSDSKRLRN